ncbi:hypothetical protein GCM10025787_36230 [Saccharopolyspora rosea]
MWGLHVLVGAVVSGMASALVGFVGSEPARRRPGRLVGMAVTSVVAAAVLCWRHPAAPDVVVSVGFLAAAVPLAWEDARHRRLPNRLMLVLYATVALSLIAAGSLAPDPALRAVLGALGALVFFAAVYLAQPDGLGGGDVKLAGPLGAVLAWHGWPCWVGGLLLGWSAAALGHLVVRASGRRNPLPFGPFLFAAAVVAMVVAHPGVSGLGTG